jgi:hypothetical protein
MSASIVRFGTRRRRPARQAAIGNVELIHLMLRNLAILGTCAVLELDALYQLVEKESLVGSIILFAGAGYLAAQLRWVEVIAAARVAAADLATFARVSPMIDAVMAVALNWFQEE